MRDRMGHGAVSMRVNPKLCEGIGMCAHLAPDIITIDPWGFPVLARGPLTSAQVRQARKAFNGCPKRALLVDGDDE